MVGDLVIAKRSVDALAVEGKDAVLWDRRLPGFGVRVYPTGRKVYVVQSRGPHGSRRATLGRHGPLSAEQARRRAAVAIDRIKQGGDPLPSPPAEPEPAMADLAQRFMREHAKANCKPSTVEDYRYALEAHILPGARRRCRGRGGPGAGCVAALRTARHAGSQTFSVSAPLRQ